MRTFALISAVAILVFSTPGIAQVVTVSPNNTYLAVTAPNHQAGLCSGPNSYCVDPNQGIPLDTFATSAAVANQFATVSSQINDLNNGLHRETSFAAAVGAMRDAIPNAGDRFAVRFNTSSVGNAVGGGFSASANLDDQFRATVSYGASRGENVVSGGLNISFH